MATVQNTVHVSRPAAEVFAFVADPANWPKWNPAVREASASERPVRVGTSIRSRAKLLGRTVELDGRVIEHLPDRRFATKALKPYPFTVTWTFEPEDGGTKVVRTGNLETTGLLRLLSPITRRLAWKADQVSLEKMKALLEARSA